MKPVHDWRRVLRRAWSVRLIILAGFLTGFEALLDAFSDEPPIARSTFAMLTMGVTMAAFIARFIAQDD